MVVEMVVKKVVKKVVYSVDSWDDELVDLMVEV